MIPNLPIGTSDFAQLRRDGYRYVDKTGFAVEVIRNPSRALLLPRPRRFGKTLNLSMLRYWLERSDEDRSSLFTGLAVESAGADVAAHFQRHPVIFLTFKDVKHRTFAACRAHILVELGREAERLRPVWGAGALDAADRSALNRLSSRQASDTDLADALRVLTHAIHLGSGEEAVLLIDEYDTPIHAGWSAGYYDDVVEVFRNLLSGGLKDNAHLYRGVVTGILRVARESLFSGLNNIASHTLLSHSFSEWFGFTEVEVRGLCAGASGVDEEGLRHWYNGYRMGGRTVYNPWSILRYLSAPEDGFLPYWVNTSSDDILRRLLLEGGLGLHADLTVLLEGGTLERPISENILLRELDQDVDAVWSFLLFCGYLRIESTRFDGEGTRFATLAIPNLEVATSYREIFRSWLRKGLQGDADGPGRALLAGDGPGFEQLLERLLLESLSSFDLGGRTPEAVYRAFVVGLLVQLRSTHVVDANRESGRGRYDICLRPRLPGQPGAVLELKVLEIRRNEQPEQALDAAMAQIRERAYTTSLRQHGATPIWRWAAVFDGKRVWTRVEVESLDSRTRGEPEV